MKTATAPLPPLRSVKVLDQLRERIRYLHYSLRTEQAYVNSAGLRPASQSRIPVEHRQVRIRDSEEGTPARGWAYFTYPARLTPLDTPRKVYTNPLAKSCISCEKGWIYRKNRYNDPEAGLCSGKEKKFLFRSSYSLESIGTSCMI